MTKYNIFNENINLIVSTLELLKVLDENPDIVFNVKAVEDKKEQNEKSI